MPKRTNDFQQLIHLIYSQMLPVGATVHESALLQERGSVAEREVDILIEYTLGGIQLRLAIECRDRSRRQDVEWIDGLIGKFRDLPVDKIVAVTKSGFSTTAIEKARANNIEIRTLEEALNTDWPSEFIKLGIVGVTWRSTLAKVQIETDPPLEAKFELSNLVTNEKGVVLGTLDEVIKDCFRRNVDPELRSYVSNNFLEIFKMLADLNKQMTSQQRVKTPTILNINA